MNIPKLRFKEFDGEWEEKKLKEVSTYSNGGSYENDVKSEGNYQLVTLKSVDMQGNLCNSGKYLDKEAPTLECGTLVMILSEQSPGLLGMTAQIPESNKYVLNQRVAEIKPNNNINSTFLSMVINRNQKYFSKKGAGTKVQNISKGNVENYEFYSPNFKEQEKIGHFFETLDKKIQLQQQKIDLLQEQKKGFLQKMFPKAGETQPEMRFDGFTGDWEERKLNEFTTYGSSSYSLSQFLKDDFQGVYPVFDANNEIARINTYAQENDYISIIKDGAGIGRTELRPAKSSVIGTMGYINPNNSDINFIYALMKNINWSKYQNGSTIPHVYYRDYGNEYFSIPRYEEQQQIGLFFKKLDDTIGLHQRKLDIYKEQKKGFMQQMFI